jgi:hypothetical protein
MLELGDARGAEAVQSFKDTKIIVRRQNQCRSRAGGGCTRASQGVDLGVGRGDDDDDLDMPNRCGGRGGRSWGMGRRDYRIGWTPLCEFNVVQGATRWEESSVWCVGNEMGECAERRAIEEGLRDRTKEQRGDRLPLCLNRVV